MLTHTCLYSVNSASFSLCHLPNIQKLGIWLNRLNEYYHQENKDTVFKQNGMKPKLEAVICHEIAAVYMVEGANIA